MGIKKPFSISFQGAPGQAITFRLYGYNGTGSPTSGTINWRIDGLIASFSVTMSGSNPEISAIPSILNGFSYFFGQGPSTYQSFNVTGTNLTEDITISAPSNYEICGTANGAYSNSIDLTPVSGEVDDEVFVRLKEGLSVSLYEDEEIELSSDGADTQYVTLNGEVLELIPTITLNTSLLNGFTYIIGNGPSTEQTYIVTGVNLTDDISLTPPTNYEISTGSGMSFVAQNPLVLSENGGSVAETTIYVRLISGLAIGSYNNEDITAASTGADTETLTLNGSVTAPAASAQVLLRPAYIDLSATSSESAVLMKTEYYTSDDARFRLYNGSNQYNSWNEATDAYVTSASYSSGPMVPGTPSTSSTFWIVFQRGNNNSNVASYRDRLGSVYGTNYQTVALPLATSISTPFTISGTFIGSGIYDNSEKYVVLAYSGSSLISAASTTLSSGTFSVVCPDGETIDKLEVRSVDNTLIEELTGSWVVSTDVGNFPCPLNLTVSNVEIFDYELPYQWQGNHYYDPLAGTYTGAYLWSAGTYYDTLQTINGCDSVLQLNLTTLASGQIWVNRNIGTAVMANWSAVPGTSKYGVRIAPEGTTSYVNYSTTGTTMRIANLQPGTEYTVEIRYFDGLDWSAWTYYQPLDFTTEVVEIFFTRDIGTRAIVEWDAIEDVSSYILQYKKSSSPNWILRGNYATNDPVVMNNLEENTDYDFRLIPRFAGVSFWYSEVHTLTTIQISYFVTKDIGTKLQAEWTPVSGASGYVMQYKKTTDAIWKSTAPGASTAAILNNLSSGTEYQLRMNLYFDGTSWGQTSQNTYNTNLIEITPLGYDGTQATFTWEALSNPEATAYYLQTKEVGSTTWLSKYTTTNSAHVTGLDPLKTYEYRLTVRYGIPEVSWGATEIYLLMNDGKTTSIQLNQEYNLFPNPVIDILTIEYNVGENSSNIWNVYDMNGKLIMDGNQLLAPGFNTFNIDMNTLSPGLYILQSNVEGVINTSRILKQ